MKKIVASLAVLIITQGCSPNVERSKFDFNAVSLQIDEVKKLSQSSELTSTKNHQLSFQLPLDSSNREFGSLKFWLESTETRNDNPLIVLMQTNDEEKVSAKAVVVYNDKGKFCYLDLENNEPFNEECFIFDENKIIYRRNGPIEVYLSRYEDDFLIISVSN